MNESGTDVQAQLDRIEERLTVLHTVVMNLLQGFSNAQNAGGVAGMMAKQFLPMDINSILPENAQVQG